MINHILHYCGNGFSYTWKMQLPFRLNLGDLVYYELLDYKGKLQYEKEETDEWINFTCKNDYFEVDYIQIDHNADVCAWLMLPKY
jgi:hypothetical protein